MAPDRTTRASSVVHDFHARLTAQMGMESPDNRPAVEDRRGLMAPARGEAIFLASAFGGSMDKPADGGFFIACSDARRRSRRRTGRDDDDTER